MDRQTVSVSVSCGAVVSSPQLWSGRQFSVSCSARLNSWFWSLELGQMPKMQWTLVVTFCIGSVVFAAPQDVQSDIIGENIVTHEPLEDTTALIPEKSTQVSHHTGNEYEESNLSFAARDNPGATTQNPQSAEAVTSENSTPIIITITRPTKKPIKKPKPVRATTTTVATTVKPVVQESPVTVAPSTTTSTPTRRYPCRCGGGLCSCCTGIILENFNVPFRSRACANVTYDPDDFAFNFKLLYNDRLLYNNRLSAKNPPPACITVNRYFGIKMCAKMTNVFLSGRNVHACLEMEGFWDDEPTFNYPFNCFRFGSEGVAVVRPEDGGGLPPPPDEEEQVDEDYDDNARGWTGDVWVIPN